MLRSIVAISGKLCSGKSALAKSLVELYPDYAVVSLAAPLKEDIATLCGVDIPFINKHKDRFRPILQYYGTDIMRWKEGENYWPDRLLSYAKAKGFSGIIVDDVRFPNEYLRLMDSAVSFLGVRLNITEKEQARRYREQYGRELDSAKLLHASETSMDDFYDFNIILRAELSREHILDTVLEGMDRRKMLPERVFHE